MHDAHLRHAILRVLERRHRATPNSLIVQELGVRHGASRVDIAVVNGRLHGYELKSDRDTLERLPEQILAYSAVLDRVTLVVGGRHAEKALGMVPEWWGIVTAEVGARGGVRLRTRRRDRTNPRQDPVAIAKLLWRDEALSLLEELGLSAGVRSAPRARIYQRLADSITAPELRRRVREILRARTGWRENPQVEPSA